MCTVTFISTEDYYILTSNRDEQTTRPSALAPVEQYINGCKVLYPQDPKVGGTWFGVNQNGVVVVLLNGAFVKYIPNINKSKSRGLILLDLISNITPLYHFEKIDLHSVEPFTMIVFEKNKLIQLKWDGIDRFKTELNISKNYIWSSVTLYSAEVIEKREKQFAEFIVRKAPLNRESIIDFHSENNNDSENGFIINRSNKVLTYSITQALVNEHKVSLDHIDLISNQKSTNSIEITKFYSYIK